MSTEQYRRGSSDAEAAIMLKDEEVDANDLEVAMINESFEEQMKQTQLFYSSNLKSIFYGQNDADLVGAPISDDNMPTKKEEPLSPFPMAEITEEDVKVKLTPLRSLPHISPHSDIENEADERGRQLDRELERMMLEEDQNYLSYSDTSPLLFSPETNTNMKQFHPQQDYHKCISYYDISSLTFIPDQPSLFSSFESHFEQQDSSECADAAEAVAFDVIRSLFDDFVDDRDQKLMDQASDVEDMVMSDSILQVLQEDDVTSLTEEEMDEDPVKTAKEQQQFEDEISTAPPPRNDSFQTTISSPMSASYLSTATDEQTVPVIDSWEELAKEPSAAEKMCMEARALLTKFRAERRATQL